MGTQSQSIKVRRLKRTHLDTVDKIYRSIRPLLNQPGVITTDQVWKTVGGPYSQLSMVLRNTMGIMVKKNYARIVRQGKWEILIGGKANL